METNSERSAYQGMLRNCEQSLFAQQVGDDDEQEEELEECEQ